MEYFCKVLIHRGEILQKFIKSLRPKVSVASLARIMDYDRTTIYQHFKNDKLEYSTILKYAKALKHDFTVEFPEMLSYISTVDEPITDYTPTTMSEVLRERDHWKDKYIALMERHNDLLTDFLKDK